MGVGRYDARSMGNIYIYIDYRVHVQWTQRQQAGRARTREGKLQHVGEETAKRGIDIKKVCAALSGQNTRTALLPSATSHDFSAPI